MGKLWNCCVVERLYLAGMLCNPFRVNCQRWRRIYSSFSLFASAFSTAASSFLWAFWVTWQWRSHLCSFLSIGCRCWNQCKHQIPYWWYHRQLPHKNANLQLKKPFKLERQHTKQKTAMETNNVDHGHAQIACKGSGNTETQTETETQNLSGASGCEQRVDSSLYLCLVANHRPHHPTTLLLFSPPSSPSLWEGSLFLQSQTHKNACSIWLLRTASVLLFKRKQLSSCFAHLLHSCSSQTSSPHQILFSKNPKTQLFCALQSKTNLSHSVCNKTHICKMLRLLPNNFKNRSPKTEFLSWQNNNTTISSCCFG